MPTAASRTRCRTSWRVRRVAPASGSEVHDKVSRPQPAVAKNCPSPEHHRLHQQSLALQRQPHIALPFLNGSSSSVFSMPLLEALDDEIEGAAILAAIASRLATAGWVALKLGASAETLRRAVKEAKKAYPRMAPGKVVDAKTGRVSTGVDPCGVPRGDRFTHLRDATRLPGGEAESPSLHALDFYMERVAMAVGEAVERESRLPFTITGRSDTMVAIFPGEGAEYGAHLDSNLHGGFNSGIDPRKLTMLLYANEGWQEASDGGQLCMHDASDDCWRTVAPNADTLVLFRSDKVLHRVAPSFRWRTALTIFLTGAYRDGSEPDARQTAVTRARRPDL